jgi:hypothetical protein
LVVALELPPPHAGPSLAEWQRATTREGYSVEVFDMSGNTMAVVTPANVLRPPTPAIVPTVRAQGG